MKALLLGKYCECSTTCSIECYVCHTSCHYSWVITSLCIVYSYQSHLHLEVCWRHKLCHLAPPTQCKFIHSYCHFYLHALIIFVIFTRSTNTVEIFEDEILHKGSTTVVCKGKFNNLPCAAKYVHQNLTEASDNWQRAQFQKGCDFLRNCQHPNVVMFLGLDLHHPRAPVLLTELMDENLEQFLQRSTSEVPLHIQIDICADVAQGLQHVHSKGYIYGDLNASNVLLQGRRAKIGGLMALIHKEVDVNRSFPPGSHQCMPMRSFRFTYNESVDCFSYGVLVMHIATREVPLPDCTSAEFESTTETKRFKSSLDQVDSSHPLRPVILNCLKEDEEERPTAAALATQLTAMKTTPEYIVTRQSSEGELRNQIDDLKREKNRLIIEQKTKEQKLKKKLDRKTSSVRLLEEAVRIKEADCEQLKQENKTVIHEYEEKERALRKNCEDVSETARIGLLAMTFMYHMVHQDCETAKNKAQCLSDETGKMTQDAIEAKMQFEKMSAEKDKQIKELRDQRTSSDERCAKFLDYAQRKGFELPD